uniref:Uncharacterized protein n=1 Tax=Anguilla anguilla TaxID=7936 RepID=A0A0E9VX64_ANGAN
MKNIYKIYFIQHCTHPNSVSFPCISFIQLLF